MFVNNINNINTGLEKYEKKLQNKVTYALKNRKLRSLNEQNIRRMGDIKKYDNDFNAEDYSKVREIIGKFNHEFYPVLFNYDKVCSESNSFWEKYKKGIKYRNPYVNKKYKLFKIEAEEFAENEKANRLKESKKLLNQKEKSDRKIKVNLCEIYSNGLSCNSLFNSILFI